MKFNCFKVALLSAFWSCGTVTSINLEKSNFTTAKERGFQIGESTRNDCSSPMGSMDSVVVVETKSGELRDYTTLQWQIGLGETLCYRFTEEEKQSSSNIAEASTIEVTYMSVRHVYSIANSYYFRLASSRVNCICDCPAGGNSCNTYTNSCGNLKNCVNFYSNDVSSFGCFLKFLKLSSALCCSIQIVPLDSRRLRAIQLSAPSVIATFRVVHRSTDGAVVDSRIYNIDLNSGASVDWEVSLQVASAGPTNSLPSGWYVEDPRAPSDLLANLPVNSLNEWDVTKLGWFKSRSVSEDHIDATGEQIIRQAFRVVVDDCSLNKFKYQFFRGFLDHDQLSGARRIEEMFPFVKSTSIFQRHVEIKHRESPLLVMSMQHRQKVAVVMKYHESLLGDFSGVLLIDSQSNAFLNLTLIDVMGTVHGTISSPNYTQALQVNVGAKFKPLFNKQLKLTGLLSCDRRGQVTISLRPNGDLGGERRSTIFRRLPCHVDSLRHFRRAPTLVTTKFGAAHSSTDVPLDCLSCAQTWAYYVDPFNWTDGLWNTTRIVIGCVSFFIALAIFLTCLKCCLSVQSCLCS